ncbi:MAG: BBP7 family outer membrane beta-barrel protein [Planctomycetales bacterium]|nr:BBP7 family outer membrane beta-barrel protein [Planctomycetales bacterium]
MKLTLPTLISFIAAMLSMASTGMGQMAPPYPTQPPAYGYPSGYPVMQTAGIDPTGTSIMAQPVPQPVAPPSSDYTTVPTATMMAPNSYVGGYTAGCDTGCYVGCDDPGCAGDCGSGKGGLFSGGGLFGGRNGGGGGLGSGGFGKRVWGGSEYLLMWHKQRTLPALVTTSPQLTPDNVAGVLGEATTNVLFGNQEISDDSVNGIRSTFGLWLDDARSMGVGFRYFDMDSQDIGYNAQSNGDPILARPFFNSDPGVNAEDSLLVAYPGISTGGVNVTSQTDVGGFDAFARYNLFCGYGNRIDFIGGYQHTEVDDVITVRHNITSVDGFTHGPVGTTINSQDRYVARNEFDGGSIGFLSEANDGRLTWSLLSKIAFGNMRQAYTIDGFTRTVVPAAGAAANLHGLLNLPSYNGTYERDEFSIVPEVTVKVAFAVTQSIQVSVGYNLMYWSDIVLANQAIDTTVNPTQVTGGLVGQAAPTFTTFPDSHSFWTQGLSFGGSITF